jgi:hypothetical protein
MNGDPLDDLLALYRRAAQEAPAARMDDYILAAARRTRTARHARWRIVMAVAACLLAALPVVHVLWPYAARNAASGASAYDDESIRKFLLSPEALPPQSQVTRYLVSDCLECLSGEMP